MYLLIPAAGSGKRMGADQNKLFLQVRSQSIIAWTLLAAQAASSISWIGIISQPHDWEDFKAIMADLKLTKPIELIAGGSTRQESVYNGLQALPADAQQVLIHDGARCLATPDLLNACAEAIRHYRGLIAAVPVKDTIKIVDESGIIQSTPDRSQLWAAQTPQGFDVELLKQCHAEGVRQGWEVTDDAALFEKCGIEVHIVLGEETNLKITTPQDLAIAEFILTNR
ncbi:2-C-methyl-D-erythritol 4-phosphate cytidylyltransferase [Anabaena cylindrica FACHB-243]|uniref:2-C-methyl-D-erythritol 4-phosphate cytidylyltransferase n=1 Tax=Anabaena cylindrica (strain ATCC 27899 / PCC 7122) TaxID=272123 RepID=K9ZGM9_ANACC|nr:MULTISPECIES: 2-C-methyl-D-erythritol 4-phosphate cytidylyltransferase [Anabaena]AFZ57525.1 2-C-methyl-D-erythritol 4-phosphate cytidylyltransferase [Anabaena cylindrica PCC 7122]MBD2418462.1 2-C-methyl-D-erythritol 4-phosphate cytidylyltransferase [Anabaena cylindrica FACHB-243]MBY5283673.1 2-C-methyl-D-erythritol 4-phosphate cytidylyltransferase [Anabaena sp. CCAP 1446/1C]MBY5308449.1 2-C-methyl-D-erythritol 4-phosphate cytidylyltransferase [Anabaena sp. CCAP 1446/1C]MCM2405111.1 2-C-meth